MQLDFMGNAYTKLQEFKFKTIEEMRNKLISLWYSIPIKLCSNIVSTFNNRVKQVSENNGERYSILLETAKARKMRRQLLNKFIWKKMIF